MAKHSYNNRIITELRYFLLILIISWSKNLLLDVLFLL